MTRKGHPQLEDSAASPLAVGWTISKVVDDIKALIALFVPELGVELSTAEIAIEAAKRIAEGENAIDDLNDKLRYAQDYLACMHAANYPDDELLSLHENLASLSQQAADYGLIKQGRASSARPELPSASPAIPAPTEPSAGAQIAEAVKVLIVVATVLGLLAIFLYAHNHPSNPTPAGGASGGTYSMYWACDQGDWQCADVHGNAYSGVAATDMSASACSDLQQQWESMRPGNASSGGTWCAQ